MKIYKIVLTLVFSIVLFGSSFAQTPTPTPEITRERREQAYAKLHEAQRYIWMMERTRSATFLKSAQLALQKAIELNPNLAEAYTTMAELKLRSSAPSLEDAIILSQIAVNINPDNYGARVLLARLYTSKSKIETENLESDSAEKAIVQWKEITRLDVRNAEAWAFLSVFYEKQNKSEERIEALKKWLASSASLDGGFYRSILGRGEDLSSENASLKLGDAYIKAGKGSEAVEILSRAVADQPNNPLAVDLLRQAIQSGGKINENTIELLRQAVFANPKNQVLLEMLAETQISFGKTDDAIKTLQNSIANVGKNDKILLANLQVSLADLFQQASRHDEALSYYEQALNNFGIENTPVTTDDQREFAVRVFEKMIRTLKTAGKTVEVKALIARARILLGKDDLFADKQLILFLRDTNKNDEALQTIRALRKNFSDDYSLLRTEASILTDLGRVEEGVALIKDLMNQKSTTPSAFYDDFTNYLFISSLYTQAKKSKEAIETAEKAFGVAGSSERKQLAQLSLATAQNQSGNFQLAETTLRGILKQTPDNPIALNNLGYFLLERNDRISEAVQLIHQALKIDPTNSSYLDSLGWGYYKLGQFSDAERYLKDALRYNSASSTTFEHLGDVYLKQGKAELAKTAWQKALGFSSDLEAKSRIKEKIGK